jgi:hypothetical protein
LSNAVADFPDEPWRLRGQLVASVFLVPPADAPVGVPPGWSPVRLAGRVVVGVAWVDYEPGGVLAYRELMATVLVRRGWRVLPTVLAIWVDSEASRDGGRALWGIPKQLAAFDYSAGRLSACEDAGPIATASRRPMFTAPGRWPLTFSIVQTLAGRALVSPVRVRGRLGVTRMSFDAVPGGPLGYLTSRRPLLSFALRDFRMRFGVDPARRRSLAANGG